MQVFVLGINHRSAPLDIRERFAVAAERQGDFLGRALSLSHVGEVLLLSTCNRVEIYAASTHPHLARGNLAGFLGEFQGLPRTMVEDHGYFFQQEEAIRHGFRVASSLDSMILGEPQILGQVKEAYRVALEGGFTGIYLNKFFHRAFHVAKRIRSETGISQNPVSVSYAAVLLSRQIFGDLADKKALVLGAGKMSEGAVRHLQSQGISKIYIANRSPEKAEEIAKKTGGETIPFERFEKWLGDADIVISSTAAPHYLISPETVEEAMKNRQGRPMFFIDIAVPRNVAPGVNQLPGVYLYDIDDLGAVVEANKSERLKEAERAAVILEKEAEDFGRVLQGLRAGTTITSLSRKVERICRRELEKAFQNMPELNAESREIIERMAFAIANKILHDPMVALKEEGEKADYGPLLRKLFRLDEV